jgi:plastocyanin
MCNRVTALAGLLAAILGVPATAALASNVRITPQGFEPQTVTVAPRQQVSWINETQDTLTLVADDDSWDSGPIAAGEAFSLDLRRPGTFPYATEDGRFSGTIEVAEVEPTEVPQEPTEVPQEPTEEPAELAGAPTEHVALAATGVPAGSALIAAGLLLVGGGLLARRARP